jgi:DNA-binding NtrC family response regulator
MTRLWIIDDEQNMRTVLKMLLDEEGYSTSCFESGEEAVSSLDNSNLPDCILSDLKMPGMDGLQLLELIRKRNLDIPFVILTGFGTIESAVKAIKLGAEDFLTKPFQKDEVLKIVARIVLRKSGTYPADSAETDIVFKSASIQDIHNRIEKLARTEVPVLITGESGTGKELVAGLIHKKTQKLKENNGPFVAVNCAAIPVTLFESELFGHTRGAFTGAERSVSGKIAQAEYGTLFLDEISELSMEAQTKLLRFLEDYHYQAIGSQIEKHAHLRVICATNQDLHTMIRESRFRQDLYYRINTFILSLPPIRNRREDILPIAEHFLRRFSHSSTSQSFSSEAEAKLLSYSWPGNARELRSVIQRAIILTPSGVIPASAIEFDDMVPEGPDYREESHNGFSAIAVAEKQLLKQYLDSTNGNITRAAQLVGVSRSTLRYRLEKYGLTGSGSSSSR